MEKEVHDAVKYANSSNELENNALSEMELKKILDDISSGKTDESFLSSVVELVRKYKGEEEEDVKVRK